MPDTRGAYDYAPDPQAWRAAGYALPTDVRDAAAASFSDAQLWPRALHALQDFGDHSDWEEPLTAEEANARFGVPGHLSFHAPVLQGDAAWQMHAAQDRVYRDSVMSRAGAPVTGLLSGLAGGLLDPVSWPLFFAPEALGLRGAVEAKLGGDALVNAGRLANAGRGALAGAAEGAAGGAIYEAADYPLRHVVDADDDYTLGSSLTNVVLGGMLGGALGGFAGLARRPSARTLGPSRPNIDAAPPEAAVQAHSAFPPTLEALTDDERMGAVVRAVDAMADDRPVRSGDMVAETLRPPQTPDLARLDEASAEIGFRARPLERDVAVTPRGDEIPVRYAIAELGDLNVSHSDDYEPNAGYPQQLQPRDRSRPGSQAAGYDLEGRLNPKLLMRDRNAVAGAPIVAPDGTVESGNGRTIALRRSAGTDGAAYGRYVQELKDQGFDLSGFERPALVRVRTDPMSGADRAALSRTLNPRGGGLEEMGAAEQAMADARYVDAVLAGTPDGEAHLGPEFVRRFVERAAPDQQNSFFDAQGRVSQGGRQRAAAALVAHAFEDPRLVETLFEGADGPVKGVSEALAEVAPQWSAMRAAARRGDIPRELDLTGNLSAAVELVRTARESRMSVASLLAERLGQVDMFSGEAISVETEAFLRLLYADEGFARQRQPGKITTALDAYARQALEVSPEPGLFGEPDLGPQTSPAGAILDDVADRLRRAEAGDAQAWTRGRTSAPERFTAALDERREAERAARALRPVEQDVRPPGEPGAGQGDVGLRPEARGGAEGSGKGPDAPAAQTAAVERPPARPRPSPAEALINADPELKAIRDDIETMLAQSGVELPAVAARDDPDLLARAIEAAEFCLGEGGVSA